MRIEYLSLSGRARPVGRFDFPASRLRSIGRLAFHAPVKLAAPIQSCIAGSQAVRADFSYSAATSAAALFSIAARQSLAASCEISTRVPIRISRGPSLSFLSLW